MRIKAYNIKMVPRGISSLGFTLSMVSLLGIFWGSMEIAILLTGSGTSLFPIKTYWIMLISSILLLLFLFFKIEIIKEEPNYFDYENYLESKKQTGKTWV